MNKRYLGLANIIVLGLTLNMSCLDPSQYHIDGTSEFPIDDVIKINSISKTNLPADGNSSTIIEILVSPQRDSEFNDILITSTKGIFDNDQMEVMKQANSSGIVSVELISDSTEGNAFIACTIKEYTVDTTITFSIAYPNDYIFSADKRKIKTDESIQFTVELFRDMGKPTDNLKVYFEVKSIGDETKTPIIDKFKYSLNQQVSASLTNPDSVSGTFRVYTNVPITENDITYSHTYMRDSIDIIME